MLVHASNFHNHDWTNTMVSYSGLWDNEYGEPHSLLTNTTGNADTVLAKHFANRIYDRAKVRELLVTLIAGAVGDTASTSHLRVQAERDLEANVQGGKRTIETFTEINRATTTADANNLVAALEQKNRPNPYPVDKSGNGGGNKLGW